MEINKMVIIGLTGTKASGKGEAAKILEKRGFEYSSLSDRVREEAVTRGIKDYTIKDLQNIGNELREKYGNGVLAKRTLENLKSKNLVIDGIRNVGEIEELMKNEEFVLVAIDSPQEKRYERLIKRARASDPKTLEAFLAMDKRDLGENEENSGQQVAKCMELADYKINNVGDVYDLYENVIKILSSAKGRPSWDEYFMKMAALAAERSTCKRHHVGAVIVKDKRVMTTGYNGAGSNLKDCIELNCLRDELKIPSGTMHEKCRAIHAEQNAIIQASKLGVNINESKMYCTHTPCMICAKMIAQAGIKEVISYNDYADKDAVMYLENAEITLRKTNRPDSFISFKD